MSKEMRRLMESVNESDLSQTDLNVMNLSVLKKQADRDYSEERLLIFEDKTIKEWVRLVKLLYPDAKTYSDSNVSYETAEMMGAFTTSITAFTGGDRYGRNGDTVGHWDLGKVGMDDSGQWADNSKSIGSGKIYYDDAGLLEGTDLTADDLIYLDKKTMASRKITIYDNMDDVGEFYYRQIHHKENEVIRYMYTGYCDIEVPNGDLTDIVNVSFDGEAGLVKDGDEQYFDISIETIPDLRYDKIEEIEFKEESKGKTPFEIFTQVLPNVILRCIENEAELFPHEFIPHNDRWDWEEGY